LMVQHQDIFTRLVASVSAGEIDEARFLVLAANRIEQINQTVFIELPGGRA